MNGGADCETGFTAPEIVSDRYRPARSRALVRGLAVIAVILVVSAAVPALIMTCPRPVKTGTLAGSHPASNGSTKVEVKGENPVPASADPDTQPPRRVQVVWQGVCTLTGRGKCRIGIHPAPWVFLYEGACGQQRDCGRCSTTKTRVKHRRQWQYNGPKTCNQMKVCQRCDARVGSRTHHAMWSQSWSVGSDKEAHRCLRCGEVQTWSTDCGD